MERRDFLDRVGKLSTAGILVAAGISPSAAKPGKNKKSRKTKGAPPMDVAKLKPVQKALGYTDAQFRDFLQQPRNQKVLSRLKDCSETSIVFKVVKAHGCLAGHKVGETFVFPTGGAMDTRQSAEKLCPFLMPPMTRLVWIIQERIWEGLPPNPLFFAGQCDDVGYDCKGFGRVVVEAYAERRPKAG